MKPKTEFVLVRGPRTDDEGNSIAVNLSMQRSDSTFDFSEYSFLRMKPNSNETIEEWVPTKELDVYKKAFGVE